MQYFTRIRGQVNGPWTLDQLRMLRDRNQLSQFHEVSIDQVTWYPVAAVPELMGGRAVLHATPTAAPPPPPQSPGNDEKWFYASPQLTQEGPILRQQLVQLIRQGVVGLDTKVWKKGMPDWAQLKLVGELRGELIALGLLGR